MRKSTNLIKPIALASVLLAGCGTSYESFDAVTVSRTGSFELDIAPDDALPLFTAPGETLWAQGWEPFILHGDGYEAGTVWVTTSHGHTTYWYVASYDTESRHARYVRVTPEADTGMVAVSVAPNGQGGSKVEISYQLTGLSASGNDHLVESFSQAEYASMMEHWRDAIIDSRDKIDDHLSGGNSTHDRNN